MLDRFLNTSQDKPYSIYVAILVISLLAVYFLGFFNPVRGDAVRYAAIAQEMLHNNNFLELQNRGGIPYLQKPPLLFWITSISFRIFGISHFAYKFPIFLISVVGIFFMYKLARLNYEKRVASLAVIFMATSFGMIFYNNDVHTDMIVMATMILSIYHIKLFLQRQKIIHLIVGFFYIGLSMMTKGPIGLAIPVFAFAVDTLLKRDWKTIFKWEWLLGLVVIAITISPAVIGVYKQFGMEGVEFYFISNHTSRITGSLRVNSTDYFFYVHTLLWEFIPWSIFIAYGFFRELKQIISNKFRLEKSEEALHFGGIIIFFVIISISKFKGPNYLIPLFPFFAVLAAKWSIMLYDSVSPTLKKWFAGIQYFLIGALWVIALVVAILNISEIPVFITGLLFILLGMAISTFFAFKTKVPKIIINSCGAIIAIGLIFNGFIVPLTFEYHSMLQASKFVNERSTAETPFVMFKLNAGEFSDDTFNFYLKPLPKFSSDLDDVLEMKSGWVFTDPTNFEVLQENGKQFEMVKKIPHVKRSILPLLNPATKDQGLKYNYLLKL